MSWWSMRRARFVAAPVQYQRDSTGTTLGAFAIVAPSTRACGVRGDGRTLPPTSRTYVVR